MFVVSLLAADALKCERTHLSLIYDVRVKLIMHCTRFLRTFFSQHVFIER